MKLIRTLQIWSYLFNHFKEKYIAAIRVTYTNLDNIFNNRLILNNLFLERCACLGVYFSTGHPYLKTMRVLCRARCTTPHPLGFTPVVLGGDGGSNWQYTSPKDATQCRSNRLVWLKEPRHCVHIRRPRHTPLNQSRRYLLLCLTTDTLTWNMDEEEDHRIWIMLNVLIYLGLTLSHMFQCVFMTCCLFMCVESERGLTQFSFVPEKTRVNGRTKL